ncbi:unnamed protein product [Blepharisma stoltei]|uniref:Uncharacterized protein n=1 Tax=Blepharisma stoltei TaxID=1481888 RepID=A0AAU9JZB3_9CILI|nr:unnamed protein product [Blepharisma stoltei]
MLSSKTQKTKAYSNKYKVCCSKQSISANNQIVSTLNKYEFSVNFEIIQDKDLKPIASALPGLTQIKKIELSNSDKHKAVIPYSKSSPKGSRTVRTDAQTSNLDPENHSTFASSRERDEFEKKRKIKGIKIFKAISENLEHNRHLTTLIFEQINIEFEGWNLLARGFNAKLPLSYIEITDCRLKDKDFACFAPSLVNLKFLNILILSKNELEDCGFDLARVISKNNERVDEIVWLAGLRGEQPEMGGSGKGLEELNLSYNKLKDKTVYDLSSALYHDSIIKALDISYNSITIQGLQEIVSALYTNSTLLYLDIFGNGKSIPISFAKVILKKLKINLRRFRSRRNYSGDWEKRLINIKNSLGPILLASEPISPRETERKLRVIKKSETQESREITCESPYDFEEKSEEEILMEPEYSESESSYVPTKKGLLGYDHTPLHESRKKLPESCEKCKEFEKALFKSESTCLALTEKIKKLEARIAFLEEKASPVDSDKSLDFYQEESSPNTLSPSPESDIDTLSRINNMMKELGKLMDAFESRNPGKSKKLFNL